ncbi:MAG: twin-arginine translocase TatA/TatE family subunit [Candidatus Binataceae bacterium]
MNILEILLILAVALIVIGPERLPEVLTTVAKLMHELRSASYEVMRELNAALAEEPPPRPKQEPPPAERQPPPAERQPPPAAQP